MTFVPISLDTFPKRTRAAKPVDIEAANTLYDAIVSNGAMSDGTLYPDETKARTAARQAVKLLSGSPLFIESGNKVRTKVGKPDGADGFAYAVFMAPGDGDDKSKSKSKSK